jgi:hypothetical protein
MARGKKFAWDNADVKAQLSKVKRGEIKSKDFSDWMKNEYSISRGWKSINDHLKALVPKEEVISCNFEF